ncbi:hypothetical protein ACKXGF_02870 [Alkalibacillus sp. S2W]|uniref:hypothetical protein n=1 Tax=Alkalibacillus sp. S2W TaxID=3386553 RepID=UPI00398C9ED2
MSLKNYKFNTKEDFVYYINHLIIGISLSLDGLEEQCRELGDFIEERQLRKRPKRVVSYKTYANYVYILDGPVSDLLNLFGDDAENGSSYRNYRKNVKKKSEDLNIDYVRFTQEQQEQLNKVTTARNWGHHNAVSLINAKKEKVYAEKLDASTPIYIPKYRKCSGRLLVEIYDKHTETLNSFKELFQLLKEDYNKLTGYPCLIYEYEVDQKFDGDSIIPEISANIQTKNINSIEEIQSIYKKRFNN